MLIGQIQSVCAQAEGETATGTAVKGRVLDVNKKDGIVDLSLLARLAVGKKDKAQKAGAELAVRAAHPRRRGNA